MTVMSGWRHYAALVFLGLGLVLPFLAAPRIKTRHKKGPLASGEQAQAASRVDYTRDIRPILEQKCYGCHGPKSQKGGLRLDTIAAIRKGGDSGAVIVPRDGANSVLVAVLNSDDDLLPAMPPNKPLDADQIQLVKAWIDAGAPAPGERASEDFPSPRVDHWAFQPPTSPPVPAVRNTHWARNPIDAFLAAGHERRGLTPNPPAGRATLLRRVSLDLTGLPPTREELQAFLADASADAYEKAVDRLLASPRYGERWGRHWMDVWRYSDPDGRKAKKDVWWGNVHVWRWRDWIVESLNADKGYDRMVEEMLAGDEINPDDAGTLAATGYLVRNWFKLDRNIWLNNTVEHTAKGFLGITLSCARCHDHKFDPISQKDYYRFRAIFEPHDICTDTVPIGGERATIAHVQDARPNDPTWIFIRGDEKTPDKTTRITPGVPSAIGEPLLRILPIRPRPTAQPTSTGRRLALARWICSRQNPLAARVAVNHIWARHFGRPLVENVADFGVRTRAPVHQQLLDWLAVDFMDRGWHMKRLHRLIVTSSAYQMQSSSREASASNLAADPDNQYYWRMNARRMEAEAVRDSLLWLAGALDTSMGGPPLDYTRGTDSARRSLYYRYSREDKMEFLTAFDSPGVEECYRRQESIVPQQALALENSAFAWDQARRMARRLEKGSSLSSPRAFVTAAFEHVLGRPPGAEEVEVCEQFLAEQERLLADPARLSPYPPPPPPTPVDPEVLKRVPGLPLILGKAEPLPSVSPATDPAARAREYLIHALLNHNDFITVR